ncbi:MAG: hypothetical protein QE263_00770 [Vampirovibrionales bacterium]|nr:hypothetical protein [Vampirovibrionales bacterium]
MSAWFTYKNSGYDNWKHYQTALAKTIGDKDSLIWDDAELKAFFNFTTDEQVDLFNTATKSLYGRDTDLDDRVIKFLEDADDGNIDGKTGTGDGIITLAEAKAIEASWKKGNYKVDVTNANATTTTPAPTAPTSGGATAPANLNGTVDASNKLTLTKNGNYEAIANYLIGNTAHAAKIAELETKRAAYNTANSTNLTQVQYVAKLVRQVTTDAYPNKLEARYPDAKLSIDLNAVLEGTLDKAKDDIQEAKAKKASGGGKQKVAKKKPVEAVTPPAPVAPEEPETPAPEEEVPEEAVAAKPTLLDTLRGRTGKLLALLLGGAALALGIQQYRANQMQMPPQGPVYSNVPPNQGLNQGLFGRNPFA